MEIRQGPRVGRRAPDGDVAAEVDEPTGQLEPRFAHRPEGARGREPLADATKVEGGSGFDSSPRRGSVDLDESAPSPVACIGRRAPVELLERAVVAGSGQRRQDRRVESPVGLLSQTEGGAQRLDQPVVDGRPRAAGAVQARQVALGSEAGEHAFAGLDLAAPCCECARRAPRLGMGPGDCDQALGAHGAERLVHESGADHAGSAPPAVGARGGAGCSRLTALGPALRGVAGRVG